VIAAHASEELIGQTCWGNAYLEPTSPLPAIYLAIESPVSALVKTQ